MINRDWALITSHATGDRERPIRAWVVLPLGAVDLRHGHCPEPPSVVADPAFVWLLSFLQPEYKVPSHTQLASLLPNRHERAKEEMKCLLRTEATVGVALTNDGSTSTTRHGNKNGAVALLGFQAFQRGFIRRNRPRDDEARLKSLEEKPSVPAGGASVPAGGANCSLYAAMELSSSFSVLGNLLRLVRNESSCNPWSFSAPSSEDLAWISNQVDPTRFFMFFHADHTCS